ncbi:hypothetical protein ACFLSJ_00170 [Verrucomicrobiota bacterium]
MAKRRKFDMKSPGAKRLVDEIVHGTFVREGTMIAFPMCFPGASTPIPADESHVTALDATPDGVIYGGTSGRRAHLFVGMFHGVTGMVLDMGAAGDARDTAAVCCLQNRFLAFVNGPAGGRVLARHYQPLPFDLIQEWAMARPPFEDLGDIAGGEPIVHAVADASRSRAVGATASRVFAVDGDTGESAIIGPTSGSGALAVASDGNVYGSDGEDGLWRVGPGTSELTPAAVRLPDGSWGHGPAVWARDPVDGRLYTADRDGRLFSFMEEAGFLGPLGATPLAPVTTMAATLDGRLFGTCGREMSRLFCFEPRTGTVADLGVAVSVMERRRYGYEFGAAVVGRDGEIVFGEDDNLGHLWLYFPRVLRERREP